MSMRARGLGAASNSSATHDSDNWRQVSSHSSKHGGGHEAAWTAYLGGEYPDYPVDILRHNHAQVYQRLAFMRDDQQDPATYGDCVSAGAQSHHCRGLGAIDDGCPALHVQNGGLLMARLRYFDPQRHRPGLPLDVAALVESLADERAVLHLVNLHPTEEREVLLQAGAFGEHSFTRVAYQQRRSISAEEAGAGHSHATQYQQTVQEQLGGQNGRSGRPTLHRLSSAWIGDSARLGEWSASSISPRTPCRGN